jgi:phosphatidate cytidylyltransferase
MAFNVQTFFTRLGSAIVFCIIMMAGLLTRDWCFGVLFALVSVLALREYVNIIGKIHLKSGQVLRQYQWYYLLMGLLLYGGLYFMNIGKNAYPQELNYAPYCFAAFLVLMLGGAWGAIIKHGKAGWQAFTLAVTGLVYISLSLGLLTQLRHQSLILPLAMILMIWTNDTFAYLVGSFIGKTPFFPAISPKKTWEGTIGGMILTVLGALAWGSYTNYYRPMDWIIMGVAVAILATAGDLLESKLKRLAGIKDSGNIMPGHGGALDRFDSMIFCAPFIFIYAWLFMEPVAFRVF